MSAVFKILIVFGGMLIAARMRVALGAALVVGGLVLCLWSGQTAVEAGWALLKALQAPELWLMLAIMILIIEVARFMTDEGNAAEIVAATRRWGGRHGRAVSLMALPAMIGLVPMPAGALFSAPLVDEAAGDRGTAAWKSAVNYWFRHIWEYWWPLYPGVIVAMAVFDVGAGRFMAAQIPLTLAAVGSGYLFLVRPHVRSGQGGGSIDGAGSNRRAFFIFLPLLIVVASVFVFPSVLRLLAPRFPARLLKLTALLGGLLFAMGAVFVDRILAVRMGRPVGQRMFSSIFKPKSISIFFSLAGVLIFKSMLTTSGLLPVAGREILASGVALPVVVAALPFLAGLVTGIALGFTGLSFPLVVGLIGAHGSGLTPLATLSLAYSFGYMGMMLSPVHLCLLVTRDFFDAPIMEVYRRCLPCVFAVLAAGLILFFIFRMLGI